MGGRRAIDSANGSSGKHNGAGPRANGAFARAVEFHSNHSPGPLITQSGSPGYAFSEPLLERICRAFDLGDYLGSQAGGPRGGSRTAISASNGEFTLRCVSKRDFSALGVHVLLDLLAYLRLRHYPVPRSLKTRADAAFLATESHFYYVSQAPSPGFAYDPQDAEHLATAAEALATLHNLVREYPGPYRLGGQPHLRSLVARALAWLDDQLRGASDESAGVLPGGAAALSSARSELAQIAPSIRALYAAEPPLKTHGSFDAAALLFDQLGIAEVDNLERTGFDLRLVDLAHSMEAFCSGRGTPAANDGWDMPLREPDFDFFLDAYTNVSPLSEVETAGLPAVLQAQNILRYVDRYRAGLAGLPAQRPSTRKSRKAPPSGSANHQQADALSTRRGSGG